MARPRVFVSSTFYDLQHIRNDLEDFIRELGYEPVLFERGMVPWVQDKKLDEQCYAEIARCDILVAIIGDKFGSTASTLPGSVTQNEIGQALKDGKQVYIFLLQTVDAAHRFYLLNRDKDLEPDYGVDVRVLKFVDTIKSLPTTGVKTFAAAGDIVGYLREQFAGLFQELLANRQQVEQQAMLNRFSELAGELARSLDKISQDRWHALIMNHPGIEQMRSMLNVKYRVYITNQDELIDWMSASGFTLVPTTDDDLLLFRRGEQSLRIRLRDFFSPKNRMINFPPKNWDSEAVTLEKYDVAVDGFDGDDEIPF